MNRSVLTLLLVCALPVLAVAAEPAPTAERDDDLIPGSVATKNTEVVNSETAIASDKKAVAQNNETPLVDSKKSETHKKEAKAGYSKSTENKETKGKITTASCMPYIGEHLAFKIGWEFINAGSTTLDISALGNNGWQVKTFARTNKFLDAFRKVRDYITAEGLCIDGKIQSTLFDANLHERKYKARKRTDYLWKENKVTHTQNQITEHFDVPAGHLSVIDAFLAVRGLTLTPGQTVNIPVFDSRKQYEIEVNVLPRKEVLKAPWGEKVSCILVKPKLKTAGIFTNKGDMLLWMTDDDRHIPLKMKARIKFGSIYAHLTSYTKDAPVALLAKDATKTNKAKENAVTEPVKAPSKQVK